MIKKKQKGLSLIEAAMVLALAAVVVSGVLYYWNSARASQTAQNISSAFMHITQQMQALYAGKSKKSYGEINKEGAGRLLKLMYPAGRAVDGYSDGIKIPTLPGIFILGGSAEAKPEYKTTGPYYVIQYIFNGELSDSEARDLCMHILNTDYGDSVYSKEANHDHERGGKDVFLDGRAPLAEVQKACGTPFPTGVTIFLK